MEQHRHILQIPNTNSQYQDVKLLRELLEASENHNTKLKDLVKILKQNNSKERQKAQATHEENQKLTKILEIKDQEIFKIRNELEYYQINTDVLKQKIEELNKEIEDLKQSNEKEQFQSINSTSHHQNTNSIGYHSIICDNETFNKQVLQTSSIKSASKFLNTLTLGNEDCFESVQEKYHENQLQQQFQSSNCDIFKSVRRDLDFLDTNILNESQKENRDIFPHHNPNIEQYIPPHDRISKKQKQKNLNSCNQSTDLFASSIQCDEGHNLITKYTNIDKKIKTFSSKKSVLFKDQLQKSQNYDKIFEDFFLIGPNPEEVNKISTTQKQCINLKPQLLYQYQNNKKEDSQAAVISDFVFPFGCQCKQMRITDSLSQINEILFQNYTSETSNKESNSFVLAFRTDEQKKIFSENLLQINPSKSLYAICYKFRDFNQTSKLQNSGHIDRRKLKFISSEQILCVLTYCPLIQYFIDFMLTLLNEVKIQRVKFYTQRLDNNLKMLNNIDYQFSQNTIQKLLQHFLKTFENIQVSNLQQELSMTIGQNQILYRIPKPQYYYQIELEWAIEVALSQFTVDQFIFIFLALMQECSIIFCSDNITKLSATLLVFHYSLLKPFVWNNPLIFNMPHSLIQLLDSPVPMLAGLNQGKQFLHQQNLIENHPNCLFIQLGSDFEIFNQQVVSEVNIDIFIKMKQKILPFFQVFNPDDSSLSNSTSNIISLGRSLRTIRLDIDSNQVKQACFQILNNVNQFIQEEILFYIPRDPSFLGRSDKIDHEKIGQEILDGMMISSKEKLFYQQFFQTQMFIHYLEENFKIIKAIK